MAIRRPAVRVAGRWRQLAAGDTLPVSILGYTPMRGDEVSALPPAAGAARQARILTVNNRAYWSDGTTWIDLTATGGRSAEFAGLEAETYALFAARTTHPSNARATVINTLIASLKSAGVWSKLGLLYLLAADNEQSARLNWKAPGISGTLTANNSPTFTTDRGFTGDGIAANLSTGVAISAIPNMSQNSAHIAAWGLLDIAGSSNWILGPAGTITSNFAQITPKGSGGGFIQSRLMGSVSVTGSATAAGNLFVASNRVVSTELRLYRSGALADVISNTSEASANSSSFSMLRSSGAYSSQQIAFASAGAGLSDAEMTALYTAVNTYLQAVGAVPS